MFRREYPDGHSEQILRLPQRMHGRNSSIASFAAGALKNRTGLGSIRFDPKTATALLICISVGLSMEWDDLSPDEQRQIEATDEANDVMSYTESHFVEPYQ